MQELVRHVDRYPEEAFLFVREALSYAADKIHGEETEAHRHLHHFLLQFDMDWSDLIAKYHEGELPEPVMGAIEAAGGCDNLNRHVSGRELCWAIRDFALQRWGIMARTVLEAWNIKSTNDFGRIIFAFIDFDMMRTQDDDSIEDFDDVYQFNEAFDGAPIPEDNEDPDDKPDNSGESAD